MQVAGNLSQFAESIRVFWLRLWLSYFWLGHIIQYSIKKSPDENTEGVAKQLHCELDTSMAYEF